LSPYAVGLGSKSAYQVPTRLVAHDPIRDNEKCPLCVRDHLARPVQAERICRPDAPIEPPLPLSVNLGTIRQRREGVGIHITA
jgi:hypothetical protein